MSCSAVRTGDQKYSCVNCGYGAVSKEQRCLKYSPADFLINILKEEKQYLSHSTFLSVCAELTEINLVPVMPSWGSLNSVFRATQESGPVLVCCALVWISMQKLGKNDSASRSELDF